MNDNREWKVSLEDALREIHRQLMEDEIYLNRRLSQGALPEELPDEEMRIRRIFSLAVMMEETIDNVLKEIENADAEAPAPEGELHSLEYKSHTIGTPDEEAASADIEDIAIDGEPTEPANAPAGAEEIPEAAEETAPADEEAPAAEEIAEAGDAAETDRTAEETGLTDAPEAEDTDAEEDEDAEVSDEWEDHDDEEEDDDEDDDDDEIPFMTDAGTSREALRAAAEKDRKEKKKKAKKEKERREKEKKKKKEKDKKDKKKDKKEKKKAKKEKKDKAGKKIKLVIED